MNHNSCQPKITFIILNKIVLDNLSRIPVILGPTAVGKTAVGILVCEALGGEIISADSRQVYKRMDIGSAKPTAEELSRAPHHIVDFIDPDLVFSAGEFVRRAEKAIEDIRSRGKLPVVVGGAGLYIKALTDGIFTRDSSDPAARKKLEDEYDAGGGEGMLDRLRLSDPEYARIVHPNDRKKLVRALEIIEVTGMRIAELARNQGKGPVEGIFCGLTLSREELYQRIEIRVDWMVENGLIEEVKALRETGLGMNLNSINSPGYIEIYEYLDGKISLESAVELIKRNTRRYAKRQMTWFRRDRRIEWFDMKEGTGNTARKVIGYIRKHLPQT